MKHSLTRQSASRAITSLVAATIMAVILPAGAAALDQQRIAWAWDESAVPQWSLPHVAVVVRHILLREQAVLQRPRASSPPLAGTTRVTPVVHVEISSVSPPADITQSRPVIVNAMLAAARVSTSGWVQLDMEARPSQRLFYRDLVRDIRASLPPEVKLSVTALAWWCRSDQWLAGLDANEIVPMFFKMGKDADAIRQTLERYPARMHPACQAGVAGFSPQEPVSGEVQQRYAKTYWFDNRRWHAQ